MTTSRSSWQHCRIKRFFPSYTCFVNTMKLNCSIIIINRLLPNLNIKSERKYKNAVLAIMKPPKDNTIYLLLITSTNKTGTRYKIQENIEKTFGQFKSEGKATIRFKEPPHDMCINADKIQLSNFMLFLKKVWSREVKEVPEIHPMTIPQVKSQNTNTLVIKSRSQYPVLQGFPSNLKTLNISKCQLKRIDNRILKLKNLTSLSLDTNYLTDVPVDLKKIMLKYLSLSHNKLGNNMQCWNFLSWPLSNSLEYLDLSYNEMKFFPASLVRFNKLKVLKLSNISYNRIPFRLFLLPNLQELDISKNSMLGLPGTVARRPKKFDILDCSDNSTFQQTSQINPPSLNSYVPSLLEISVRKVVDYRLPYNEETMPKMLVPLLDYVKLCICGKACLRDFGDIFSTVETKSLANTFISSHHSYSIPIIYKACCPQHTNLKK